MESFNTKNEAVLGIQWRIEEGQYKDCSHLKFAESDGPFGLSSVYVICCEERSFATNGEPESYVGHRFLCPDTCVYFRDRQVSLAEAERKRTAEAWRRRSGGTVQLLLKVLASPFIWFQKLSGMAQGLILLLILIYFSPRLADSVIKLVQALK